MQQDLGVPRRLRLGHRVDPERGIKHPTESRRQVRNPAAAIGIPKGHASLTGGSGRDHVERVIFEESILDARVDHRAGRLQTTPGLEVAIHPIEREKELAVKDLPEAEAGDRGEDEDRKKSAVPLGSRRRLRRGHLK